jgi:hypothetical protein
MKTTTKMVRQYPVKLAWDKSYPAKNLVEEGYQVEDGLNLPNSETEDVGGFSLRPNYSVKQLRRINRLLRRTTTHRGTKEVRNITPRHIANRSDSKYVLIKQEFVQEGLL